MPIGPSFDGVLAAAQIGSEWAWVAIYDEYSGPLAGYLRSRGVREVEDRLGDVFLQVARNLKSFQGGEAEFRSWIFIVAHHRLIDERRRFGRRKEDPVDPVSDLVDVAPPVESAEYEALANVASEETLELLDQLTPDQRSALGLRVFGGLTIGEIAEAMGKRPGSVKALQRRALETLRKELQKRGVPF